MCGLRGKVKGLWPISVPNRVEGILLYSQSYMNALLHSIHSTLSVALSGHISGGRPT